MIAVDGGSETVQIACPKLQHGLRLLSCGGLLVAFEGDRRIAWRSHSKFVELAKLIDGGREVLLGGGGNVFESLFGALLDDVTGQIGGAKTVLSNRVAFFRGLAIAFDGFHGIGGRALAVTIAIAERDESGSVLLLGGEFIPTEGDVCVLDGTVTFLIAITKLRLRFRIAFLRGEKQPVEHFIIVDGHALAALIAIRKMDLRTAVAFLRGGGQHVDDFRGGGWFAETMHEHDGDFSHADGIAEEGEFAEVFERGRIVALLFGDDGHLGHGFGHVQIGRFVVVFNGFLDVLTDAVTAVIANT